jgi:hypothetical protein
MNRKIKPEDITIGKEINPLINPFKKTKETSSKKPNKTIKDLSPLVKKSPSVTTMKSKKVTSNFKPVSFSKRKRS